MSELDSIVGYPAWGVVGWGGTSSHILEICVLEHLKISIPKRMLKFAEHTEYGSHRTKQGGSAMKYLERFLLRNQSTWAICCHLQGITVCNSLGINMAAPRIRSLSVLFLSNVHVSYEDVQIE